MEPQADPPEGSGHAQGERPPAVAPAGLEQTPERDKNTEEQSGWRALGEWSGVGFEFAAAVGLFFLLGTWLDATWGTPPWMGVAGAFVGIVLGTYLLIKKALASDSSDRSAVSPRVPPDRLPRPRN